VIEWIKWNELSNVIASTLNNVVSLHCRSQRKRRQSEGSGTEEDDYDYGEDDEEQALYVLIMQLVK